MNDREEDKIADPTEEGYAGDWETVARMSTPTEANLLRGVLQAAGIPAAVADANLVQAHSWMTNAVGGVRVQVPSSFADAARRTIAEYEQGAFQLDGDDEPASGETPQSTSAALFGPGAAILWSFLLTPLFGTILHYLNARALKQRQLMRTASWWLAASALGTCGALYVTLSVHWEIAAVFEASAMASAFTAVWYIAAGYTQSKYIASTFGTRYAKRSLMKPVCAALTMLILLGLAGTVFN